jgi:hypothetical protein
MKQQRRSSACNPEVYLCCREKRAGVRTKPLALAGLRVASARRVYCKGCDGTSWQTKNGGSLKIKFEVTASRHGRRYTRSLKTSAIRAVVIFIRDPRADSERPIPCHGCRLRPRQSTTSMDTDAQASLQPTTRNAEKR